MTTLSFEEKVDTFLGALRERLEDRLYECCIPVTQLSTFQPITVYVDRGLAKKMTDDTFLYRKHLMALKHGYVGNRRGLNGIRDVHENDGRIFRLANNFLKNRGNVIGDYGLNLADTKAIKVVAHDPSGRRLYGIMDTRKLIVVLIGVGYYK